MDAEQHTVPDALTQEQRDLLELLEMVRRGDVALRMWGDTVNETIVVYEVSTGWTGYAGPMLAKFRNRLRPQKPTEAELIAMLRKAQQWTPSPHYTLYDLHKEIGDLLDKVQEANDGE